MHNHDSLSTCLETASQASTFNPLWLILLVNIFAIAAAPYLSYIYSHFINLKSLKEKWIGRLRDTATSALEVSEELFRSTERMHSAQTIKDQSEEQKAKLDRSSSYSRFCAIRGKIRLLFKSDDERSKKLDELLNELQKGAESASHDQSGNMTTNRDQKDSINARYIDELNDLLYQEWQTIQDFRFWAYIRGRTNI